MMLLEICFFAAHSPGEIVSVDLPLLSAAFEVALLSELAGQTSL